MSSQDDLAADLPPSRDDEPASLRQDIFDELADHLACALDRERQRQRQRQRQSALPETAESPAERVLKRFGNPAQIALRLWRDAMWGKIVTQRIVIALASLVAVACCAAVFVSMRLVGIQERALADQRAAFETLLAQQRELIEAQANARAQSVVTESDTSALWSPVEIQLRPAVPSETLPAGFAVFMGTTDTKLPLWTAKTDETSRVFFPLVRYGRHTIRVESPWGEDTSHQVSVMPGIPLSVTIDCPAAPGRSVVVRPQLVLPEGMQERKLLVGFSLRHAERSAGSFTWTMKQLPDKTILARSPISILAGRENYRPYATADSLDPFLVHEGANLRGVLWPGKEFRPDSLFLGLLTKGERQSNGTLPFDRTGEFGHEEHLYCLTDGFILGRDLESEVDVADRRLQIRLTAVGEARLREALSRFDAADQKTLKSYDIATRDDYELYPPLASQE